jgi:hypothetical protein
MINNITDLKINLKEPCLFGHLSTGIEIQVKATNKTAIRTVSSKNKNEINDKGIRKKPMYK